MHQELTARLAALELASHDMALLRTLLVQLVHGYTPDSPIVDWVYLQQSGVGVRGNAA